MVIYNVGPAIEYLTNYVWRRLLMLPYLQTLIEIAALMLLANKTAARTLLQLRWLLGLSIPSLLLCSLLPKPLRILLDRLCISPPSRHLSAESCSLLHRAKPHHPISLPVSAIIYLIQSPVTCCLSFIPSAVPSPLATSQRRYSHVVRRSINPTQTAQTPIPSYQHQALDITC